MNKDETTKLKEAFKKDEALVKKDVEEKTRVEEPSKKPKEEATKVLERISGEMWERLLRKVFGEQLTRIERMLEWLVVQRVTDAQKLIKQPNITDILKQIAVKMEAEKPKEAPKEKTEEEKEDEKTEGGGPSEVPPTT